MAKTKGNTNSENQIVVMSKMDFEIATLVYKRLLEIGMTDEELSFLLGKRNKYFFELLDPTEKNKFKTEQLDILPTILNTPIKKLVPNDLKPNETIKVGAVKKTYKSKIVYKYVIFLPDNTESEPVTIIKKIEKGNRKKVNQEVHDFIIKQIGNYSFNIPKNALELFLICKKGISTPFNPTDLQKSLATCCRDNGVHKPLLVKEIVNAKYVYTAINTK